MLRRVLMAMPILVAVTFFSYLMAVGSGNQFWQVIARYAKMGYKITPQQVLQMQEFYHVNQPVFEGYFLWLGSVLQGNLGITINGQSVASTVFPWIMPTLVLQVSAIVTSMVLGLVVGVYSAGRRGSRTDASISASSAILLAVPSFWLATFAILIFSLRLHLLPSFGFVSPYPPYWWGDASLDVLAHFVMPFSVLVAISTPVYERLARAGAIETLSKDWVTALYLSGVSKRRILYSHVLKNSLGPVLAIFAVNLGIFLAASPGIEYAFSWPGLGLGFAKAALNYDQPVMIAIILVMSLITVSVWVLADFIQGTIDPRVAV